MTKEDLEKLEKFKPITYKKYFVRLGFGDSRYPSGVIPFVMTCTKQLPSWYEVIRLNGKIERVKNPKCRFGDLDRVRELRCREQIILHSHSIDNLINNYKYVIDIQVKKKMHYKIYRKKLLKLFYDVQIDWEYDFK